MTYQEIIDKEPAISLLVTMCMDMNMPENVVIMCAAAAWHMNLTDSEDNKSWAKDKGCFDIVMDVIKGDGDLKTKLFTVLVKMYKEIKNERIDT